MSDDNRFVFDTNVLISALLFEKGKPGRAFRQDLLDLNPFRDIAIVTADQFLTLTQNELQSPG